MAGQPVLDPFARTGPSMLATLNHAVPHAVLDRVRCVMRIHNAGGGDARDGDWLMLFTQILDQSFGVVACFQGLRFPARARCTVCMSQPVNIDEFPSAGRQKN